jgi:hypothetical protein
MRSWIALAALGVAFAWPMQVNGYNQNAHYALVRALAVYGTPYIDKTRGQIGDVSTSDVSTYKGHVYAAKAPGLAFVSVPAFLVLKAIGMRTTGDPTRVIWALHLWSIVLPALLLLLLVQRVADRLAPGTATTVAVTLGLGTLLLPFATLFFSHVLAAMLGFAAFAVLVRERVGYERLALVVGAGVLAGLAVCVDYPLALAGAIVGLYAIARGSWWRRGLVYSGGVLVGLLPLLAFNWWAFGTPTHIAYEDYYAGGKHAGGTFGFGRPSLSHMHDLLFSTMGILVLTPVVAAAVVGAGLLVRRRRAEAAVALAVVVAYYLWNSSLRYASAFGGLGPPRYLFPLIPFLGVGLVCAWRRFPVTTLALALVSAFQMVVTTATGPLAAYDGEWMHRVRTKEFVQSASAIVGVTGWYAIVVFLGACAVAGWVGWSRVRGAMRDAAFALGAVGVWALVALAADNPNGRALSAAYVIALGAAAAIAAALVGRTFTLRRAPRPAAEAG